MLHIQNLKRWYHPTVKLHTAFCMTSFCHARNMSDRYWIGPDRITDRIKDRIKDWITDRIADRIMLFEI